MDHDDEATKRR